MANKYQCARCDGIGDEPEPNPSRNLGNEHDAYVAGWEACRLAVYEMCEDVDREATQDWPDGNLQARGMMRAAKSISRGFGAMSAPISEKV